MARGIFDLLFGLASLALSWQARRYSKFAEIAGLFAGISFVAIGLSEIFG